MSIFSKIFGKSDTSALIDKLDGLIDQLPISNYSTTDSYDNLASKSIKEVIKYSDDPKENEKNQTEIEQIFNGITVPKERINRYNVYDELYKTVSLIKRIFSVYTANVFQKDTVTNKILYIRDKTNLKDDTELEVSKKVANLIIDYYNLDDKLKHFIGHNVFKYGDAFIELLDLDEISIKFPVVNDKIKNSAKFSTKEKAQLVTETREIISNGKKYSEDRIIDSLYDNLRSKNKYKQINLDNHLSEISELFIEFSDTIENNSNLEFNNAILENDNYIYLKNEKPELLDETKLKRVAIRLHKPHKIIPLISPYGNILGFIEMQVIEKSMTTNNLSRFLEIAEKISSIVGEGTKESTDNLVNKFVDYTVKKVLEKYKIVKQDNQSFSDYEQSIRTTLKDDLFYSLKQVYLSIHKDSLYRNKAKIRFIEPKNIFWFKSPSSEYFPFGQSLIDPLVIPGKLLTFTQLANAVMKLSRASLIRKWTVELGSREDSSALLQKLKRSFKNQRVTASDLGSTKDIAQILSDFKDLVVDLATVESNFYCQIE